MMVASMVGQMVALKVFLGVVRKVDSTAVSTDGKHSEPSMAEMMVGRMAEMKVVYLVV